MLRLLALKSTSKIQNTSPRPTLPYQVPPRLSPGYLENHRSRLDPLALRVTPSSRPTPPPRMKAVDTVPGFSCTAPETD